MKPKSITVTQFFLFVYFYTMFGVAMSEPQPISEMKSFLAASKTMTADFKQVSYDEFGNPLQKSFGVFYLQRPGKFRWDYRTPFVQQIISNSDKVWFYDADLEQVTVKNIDQSLGSTPALLLSGELSLEDNFIVQKQGMDEGLQWIKLLPKNDQSGFNYILIGMENQVIGGMELSDNFGQLTRIYFSNIKINNPIAADIFQFEVPDGVDVFEDKQ
jgi:outer membrane lipoprotein carrier protein